jgi:hypothetical protein
MLAVVGKCDVHWRKQACFPADGGSWRQACSKVVTWHCMCTGRVAKVRTDSRARSKTAATCVAAVEVSWVCLVC